MYILCGITTLFCHRSLKILTKKTALYHYSQSLSQQKIRSFLVRNILELLLTGFLWNWGGRWILPVALIYESLTLKHQIQFVHFYRVQSKKVAVLELCLFGSAALVFAFIVRPDFSLFVTVSAILLLAFHLYNTQVFNQKILMEYEQIVKRQKILQSSRNLQSNMLKILSKDSIQAQELSPVSLEKTSITDHAA